MKNSKVSVIPKPEKIELSSGEFVITNNTVIECSGVLTTIAGYFADKVKKSAGVTLNVSEIKKEVGDKISLILTDDSKIGSEGYKLTVTPTTIKISATTPAGIFYAIQTLLQLLPAGIYSEKKVLNDTLAIPCVTITDKPRFNWRGMHLDVARHFMPVDFIKKFLELMAMHKMNIFHWHLTEDQGWRIEIKKYPKLTELGSIRSGTIIGHQRDANNSGVTKYDNKPHSGFYTQNEIRDIVEYAAERFITIVPEIDIPGHAQAAIAAYPELGCTDEKLEVKREWGVCENILNPENSTVEFMQNVLQEVIDLFPSEYIHIGGDEVPKKQWNENRRIQELREERGLKDMDEMQSWFIRHMDEFLQKKGRKLIGWDEILEGGLAPSAAVMSWRNNKGAIAAAKMDHDAVMSDQKFTYFDYYQADKKSEPLAIGGNLPWEKVYSYQPIPEELTKKEAKHIIGVQGQVWTEYIPTPEHAEYMTFPRACALSEVQWSSADRSDADAYRESLKKHLKRLDSMNVNYRKIK